MNFYGASVLLVIFGGALAVFDLVLLALTPRLIERLSRLSAGKRADAILFARSFPLGLAALLAVFVFLPAWLIQEPADTGETVSYALALGSALSLLPIFMGVRRGVRIFLKTRERLLHWRGRGRNTAFVHAPYEVLEVKGAELALCVGGYLKPTIYASTEVMNTLEPGEFEAALAHEVSHAATHDPLRLLWMGACPDFLQFLGLDERWRHAFSTACEFAADEGAIRGDREVALDLASALLKVARLQTLPSLRADTLADVAVSSAFSSRADLEARVRALAEPAEGEAASPASLRPWMLAAVSVGLLGLGVIASEPVHAMTEIVGAFLAFR